MIVLEVLTYSCDRDGIPNVFAQSEIEPGIRNCRKQRCFQWAPWGLRV